MNRTLVGLLALLPVSVAHGQTPPTAPVPARAGPVTYGAGHKLCRDWSAAETKADQGEYFANRFWVAGFMSSYNVYVSTGGFDIGRGLTPDDMKSWMHARCAANPTETIATAATAFIAYLRGRQGR